MLCGALVCGALGVAATRFGVDQIVAGTGLNVIAIAAAAFGVAAIWGAAGVSPEVKGLGNVGQAVLIVVAVALAFGVDLVLNRTPFGLRLRACGENPRAVRSAGIDPLRHARHRDGHRGSDRRASAASTSRLRNCRSIPKA